MSKILKKLLTSAENQHPEWLEIYIFMMYK